MPHLTTSYIIIYFLIGIFTAYFAKKSNKNPYLWFFLGISFGIFAILTLVILNYNRKKEQRPKLKKELDIKMTDSRFWYYLTPKNESLGPFSLNKIKTLFLEKKISSKTYVWTEEFKNWKFLKDIKEYKKFFLPARFSNSGNKPLRRHISKTNSR